MTGLPLPPDDPRQVKALEAATVAGFSLVWRTRSWNDVREAEQESWRTTTRTTIAAYFSALQKEGVRLVEHAEVERLTQERDEAILERDEMRRANVTPEDADRPLGQSVEYWQDRCLDHATHLDRARAELRVRNGSGLARMVALDDVVEALRGSNPVAADFLLRRFSGGAS